jgi:GNAT superfamily N-acetyltransferase
MNQSELNFVPLAQPRAKKTIRAFLADAGWPERKDDTALTVPGRCVQWVCVERAGTTLGIARLELAPPQFCYVASVVVKRQFHRQGIGRWLLRNIEAYCVDRGIQRLLLSAERGSEPFYDAMFFVPDPLAPPFLKKELNPFQKKRFLPV